MHVVGAGGNGSIFITHLCRIHQAWTKLGGEPFTIRLWDPDRVSEANLARQVFCEADVGQAKALVLAQRMSAFFGIEVKPEVERFNPNGAFGLGLDNAVIVGCVDNLEARRLFAGASEPHTETRKQWGRETSLEKLGCYWLDMGNTADKRQVILGGHGLRNLFAVLPELKRARDPKDLPSCSMAEALSRQDLFINSTIATLAGQLLWQLMRKGGLNHHGYFVNLAAGRVVPVPVKT